MSLRRKSPRVRELNGIDISLPDLSAGTSPPPTEPDVMVTICLTQSKLHAMKFVACESAARRFADHWKRYGRCGAIVFAAPDGSCGRLPCERLWLVP